MSGGWFHCSLAFPPRSAASLAGLNVVQLMSTSAAGNRELVHARLCTISCFALPFLQLPSTMACSDSLTSIPPLTQSCFMIWEQGVQWPPL